MVLLLLLSMLLPIHRHHAASVLLLMRRGGCRWLLHGMRMVVMVVMRCLLGWRWAYKEALLLLLLWMVRLLLFDRR